MHQLYRNSLILIVGFLFFALTPAPTTAAGAEPARLTGLIADIAGKPVKGAQVFAYTNEDVKQPGDFISRGTGDDGRYELQLPAGTYWVVARLRLDEALYGPLSPRDKHSGDAVRLEVKAGGDTALDLTVADIREIALIQPKKREDFILVHGRVVDRRGQPAAMVYVMASSRQKPGAVPEYFSGWTDGAGRYTLYLPRGIFYLGMASTFPPPKDIMLEQKVETTAEGLRRDMVFETLPPDGALGGH